MFIQDTLKNKKMNKTTHYNTRSELLELVPKNCNFLEIGVFVGDFAKEILEKVSPKNLYLVDIWLGKYGSGNKDGENHYEIEDMQTVYLNLYQKYKDYNNIHLVRSASVPFLQSCENDFFDVIYIDGDHTAQAVYDDIFYSYQKIKNGGIIMGHDYHYQVKYAVDLFCEQFNQEIKYIADDGCPSFFIEIKKS
jgi:hypothetical protein